MRKSLTIIVAAALVLGACSSAEQAQPTPSPDQTGAGSPRPSATTIPAGLALRPFGSLEDVPLLADDPHYAGPATPTSMEGVVTTAFVDRHLDDPRVAGRLTELGFVAVADQWRLFHHVYENQFYEGFPVFVTTDVAAHAWHQLFDKVLRDTEEEVLLPTLERLVTAAVDQARAQRDELAGTPVADAADRAAQLYEAAATVLGLDVGQIGDQATQEVALIREATQLAASPITSFGPCGAGSSVNCVNYALFRPRGHYTRSDDLQRYFRAMSLFGQSAFFLDPESLRVGLLATRALLASDATVADWQLVYEPTAFLVGASDDYTPFELAAAAADVAPDGLHAPVAFADPDVLGEVADGLRSLRPVQINPEAASARLMGVRLTLDGLVLDQLVSPAVPNRFEASALDVAAAFGSDWALGVLQDAGLADQPGYVDQLQLLRRDIAARTIDDWGRTVYDAWLWSIAPQWAPHGLAHPDFMRTDAWAAKAHQAGLGSYAELKHDTILYAKQAIAEGGGDEPPAPPRHWVEPDPVLFERLGQASALLHDGLADRGMVTDDQERLFDEFGQWLADLGRIARDELAGRPLSPDDNLLLESTGGFLEHHWIATSDLARAGEDAGPDDEAALVADILTSSGLGALEVATGRVDTLLVLVPDDDGTFQVAVGGVYSFHQFWQDPSQRLTDQQWRAMLDAGDAPPRPAWQDVFVVQ